jgi:membrane protein implicated in regulation of membrane protease activity
MSQPSDPSEKNRGQYAFNLTLAAVAGQVGCLTLVIVLAALFGGLWLDSRFNTRPTFTVVLMVASVPVTLVAMFAVVRAATSRLRNSTQKNTDQDQEEADRGKTS